VCKIKAKIILIQCEYVTVTQKAFGKGKSLIKLILLPQKFVFLSTCVLFKGQYLFYSTPLHNLSAAYLAMGTLQIVTNQTHTVLSLMYLMENGKFSVQNCIILAFFHQISSQQENSIAAVAYIFRDYLIVSTTINYCC
jgi:hypothetical protein